MNNTICHIEFQVTDMVASQRFYEGLFGWTFRTFGEDMCIFGLGDEHIGGLQRAANVSTGDSPSVWFRVADLDASVRLAEELGGSAPDPKHPVPGVGFSQAILDLDGNRVGLVQYVDAG